MPSSDTWSPIASDYSRLSWEGRVRSWVVTPNFGSLAKDDKPVNLYTDEHLRETATPSHSWNVNNSTGAITVNQNYVHTDNGAGLHSSHVNWLNTQTTWSSDTASLDNACIVEALVKMADAKVNLPVALAEASKTSDLIYDTARRIDRAYRAFRRGNLKGVAENLNITPKKLHKSWLEYKYGWMPLLMDVKGAAEFFAQKHVGRPDRFVVTRKKTLNKVYVWKPSGAAYGGGANVTLTLTFRCERNVRTTFWCELSYPHAAELQQLGMTNPALVAWELVPYSFVFDWFIQVGDWLTALTAQNGINVRRKMFSAQSTMDLEYVRPATVRTQSTTTYFQDANLYTENWRVYGRTPVVSTGTIVPTMEVDFGFKKLITSLALIRGSYRGNARL